MSQYSKKTPKQGHFLNSSNCDDELHQTEAYHELFSKLPEEKEALSGWHEHIRIIHNNSFIRNGLAGPHLVPVLLTNNV